MGYFIYSVPQEELIVLRRKNPVLFFWLCFNYEVHDITGRSLYLKKKSMYQMLVGLPKLVTYIVIYVLYNE